jgi:hypothetical protein
MTAGREPDAGTVTSLSNVPLLAGMTEKDLGLLARMLKSRSFAPGRRWSSRARAESGSS